MGDDLLQQSLESLRNATSEDELTDWYRDVLGRKGSMSEAMRTLGELSPDERRERGRQLNEIKQQLEAAF
jgi:phenylalanyl-tRNA synthetase alpha chain